MLLKKSLVYYSIFCHLSSFYQHEFEFGDQKIFPMGTFVCIHTGGILCRPKNHIGYLNTNEHLSIFHLCLLHPLSCSSNFSISVTKSDKAFGCHFKLPYSFLEAQPPNTQVCPSVRPSVCLLACLSVPVSFLRVFSDNT